MQNSRTLVLPLINSRTDEALRSGSFDGRRLIARQVMGEVTAPQTAQVLFEILDQKAVRPKGLAPWMQAIRAYSLTATATPCLAVLFLALAQQQSLNAVGAVCALLGVLGLQIAINVFNDVEDYRRLIDLPGGLGGSGMIQNGWWTPLEFTRLAWTALILGSLLAIPAVIQSPQVLIPIAIIGGLGVLLYSAKRIGLKYVALGDVAVFVLCGPALTIGYGFAIVPSEWSSSLYDGVIALGVFFGLLATAILHVNNLQDLSLDQKRGVKTLAIVLGFKKSLWFLSGLYLFSGFTLIFAGALGGIPWVACLGFVPLVGVALPWLKTIRGALGPESSLLSHCRIKAAQIHLMSGVALILGLAASVIFGKVFG